MNKVLEYILRLKDELTDRLRGVNRNIVQENGKTYKVFHDANGIYKREVKETGDAAEDSGVKVAKFAAKGFAMWAAFERGKALGEKLNVVWHNLFDSGTRAANNFAAAIEDSNKRIEAHIRINETSISKETKAYAEQSEKLATTQNQADALRDAGRMRTTSKSAASDAQDELKQAEAMSDLLKKQHDKSLKELWSYQRAVEEQNARTEAARKNWEHVKATDSSIYDRSAVDAAQQDYIQSRDLSAGYSDRVKKQNALLDDLEKKQAEADRRLEVKRVAATTARVRAETEAREKAEEKLLSKRMEAEEELKEKAQDRLVRATAAADRAWEEYKDPTKYTARKADEDAESAFEKQYKEEREYVDRMRASGYGGRLDRELVDRIDAVTKSRADKSSAEAELKQIEVNTKDLAKKLDDLLTLKDEGGK